MYSASQTNTEDTFLKRLFDNFFSIQKKIVPQFKYELSTAKCSIILTLKYQMRIINVRVNKSYKENDLIKLLNSSRAWKRAVSCQVQML